MRDIVGISPVHPALLLVGKIALAACWAVLALRLAGVDLLRITVPPMRWPAALATLVCSIAIVAALVHLGEAARVGLPEARTRLRTSGLYAASRNPIYTAALVGCVTSCLYVPHWLNILCALATAVIHHRIVLAEERFLAGRFGEEWERYRARVRRY
ncbi:MAG: Isoprenylcysteine carboxyl methyltransferase [Acidobacteria bacterium]|nr:Isoprenylcysteine carboxyl methyltransferase [Acidobacteriota bacterium]